MSVVEEKRNSTIVRPDSLALGERHLRRGAEVHPVGGEGSPGVVRAAPRGNHAGSRRGGVTPMRERGPTVEGGRGESRPFAIPDPRPLRRSAAEDPHEQPFADSAARPGSQSPESPKMPLLCASKHGANKQTHIHMGSRSKAKHGPGVELAEENVSEVGFVSRGLPAWARCPARARAARGGPARKRPADTSTCWATLGTRQSA